MLDGKIKHHAGHGYEEGEHPEEGLPVDTCDGVEEVDVGGYLD